MADVSIDAAIGTATARGMRSLVFVSADVGYCFFIDGDADFFYIKTTDGGASWSGAVEIDTDITTTVDWFDVWYDRWTPGDTTGTKIHIVWVDQGDDDPQYVSLDTSNDTLGTQVTVFTGTSTAAGIGVHASITKAVGGNLYVSGQIDAGAERFFSRSVDGGATFGARAVAVEAVGDWSMLFPGNAADNQDIWAVYFDADANALTLKAYDNSADSWSESATIMGVVELSTDLTGQYPFSASIRHSDGHLVIAALTGRGISEDHRVFDVNGTGSITALTNIATDSEDHYYPSVFIHQATNDLYVAYNGKRDGSETLDTATKVYYTKSTDDGTTWSSGDTAYMEGAAAVVLQTWAPIMGDRFYVAWRRASTVLAGNAVNSVAFGAAAEFEAAVVGSAIIAGALTTAIEMAAAVSTSASAAASLSTEIQMAAAATGSATVAAALTTEIPLAAAALGSATVVAELTAPQQALFEASLSGTASAAGALATAIECAAAVTGSASAVGALSTEIQLAGAVTATATASGSLTTEIALAGACAATGTTSGALTTAIQLAGSLLAPAVATGDLTVSGLAEFQASVLGSATVAAGLTTVIQFEGTVTGAAVAAGELLTAITFEGSVLGEAVSAADLTVATAGEPYAELTVYDLYLDGVAPAFRPAALLMRFRNDGRVYLHVRNAGSGVITITIPRIAPALQRQAHTVEVPAAGERLIGPFSAARFGTRPQVTCPIVTDVDVQARRVRRFGVVQHLKD
jgi:hypothetical protein